MMQNHVFLVVFILDRPRHGEIIAKTREAGARIMLIVDGDVSGVIATAWPKSGIDPIITISSYDHLVSRGHPRRLDVKNRNWFLQAPKALETLVQNLNTGTETKQHFFFNKGKFINFCS